MYVRSAPTHLVAQTNHPAWLRFRTGLLGTESVLLIHAPSGLGRGWFAQSWSDSDDVSIVHVGEGVHPPRSSAFTTARSLTDAMQMYEQQLRDQPDSPTAPRLALVIDSSALDWAALADHHWRLARTSDLLMTVTEITEAAAALQQDPPHRAVQAQVAARLLRVTGGWLEPTLTLLHDPAALTRAHETMLPFLSRWIVQLDDGWEMAKAAFLEPITEKSLAAFFREVHGSPPSIDDLISAGLLAVDETGTPFMPDLIQSCLQALVRQNDRALADDLVAVAVDAVAETENLASALQHAVSRRHWGALGDLLMERWTELFTSDARVVRAVVEAMPTAIVERWLGDFSGTSIRLLKGAGPDGMSFVLPDGSVEYERDGLAQRLRAKTRSLYGNPGPKALSFGLLEVGYLRLAGHDAQAAIAARHLLSALERAQSAQRIRPVLASVVNLHAGVSLAIGGHYVAAYSSYRAAFYDVAGSGHHFLLSDTTSKLALLTAVRGDTREAREWITEHDRWVGKVGWGQEMVTRSTRLARVLVALAELDLEGADAALRALPSTPDSDEMWQVHAHVLAMRDVLAGQPRRALVSIAAMRYQRPHPSQTQLAQHLFAIAEHTARAANQLGAPAVGPSETLAQLPELHLLEACRVLLIGDVDRAAHHLSQARSDGLGERWLNLAMQLHIILDRQDKSDMVEYLVDDVVSEQGALVDLALLQRHAVLTDSDLKKLSSTQRARLATISPVVEQDGARPALTPRELEVLDGLRQGLTRRQIAERQFRSENTVRSQVRSLYQKLGAGTLDEALETARRWGL